MSSPDVDALQVRLTAMERKVRVMSVAGKNRIYLGLSTGKGQPTPQVLLADENETQRLYMGWSDTVPEKPLMFIHDESGKDLWHAP